MKNDSSKILTVPRVILYLSCFIICSVLLFLSFFSAKSRLLIEAQTKYHLNKLEQSIAKSKLLISKHSETKGHLWLAKNYDKISDQLQYQQKLKETYQNNSKNSFYHKNQQQGFKKRIVAIDAFFKKWPKIEECQKNALENYELYLKSNKDSSSVLAVVEEHYLHKRFEKALKLISSTTKFQSKGDEALFLFFASDIYYLQTKNSKEVNKNWEKATKSFQSYIAKFNALPEKEKTLDMGGKVSFSHTRLAQIAIHQQKHKEVDSYFEKSIPFSSQSALIYFQWAEYLVSQKRYIKAQEVLKKAVAQRPNSANINYLYAFTQAHLWQRLQAMEFLNKALYLQRTNAKRPVFHKALKDKVWQRYAQDPHYLMLTHWGHSFDPVFQQGITIAIYDAWVSKKFDRAVGLCSWVTKQDKKIFAAHAITLFCSLGQKKHRLDWEKVFKKRAKEVKQDQVMEYQKDLLKKDTKKRQAELDKMGEKLEIVQQRIKTSMEQTDKLAKSMPEKLSIVYAYFRWGFFEETLAKLRLLMPQLKDKKLQSFAFFMEGFSFFKQKKYPKAIASYNKAIDLSPDVPVYFLLKAQVLKKQKKIVETISCYQKAIAIDKKVPDFYYQLAMFLISAKKYQEAEKHLNTCIALSPSRYLARYQLARLLLIVGKKGKAFEMLESTFKLRKSKIISGLLQKDTIWHQHMTDVLKIIRKYSQ